MTGIEVAGAILKTGNELTKEHQKGFIHYVLVTFFGDKYFKYLSKSLILEGVAKMDAENKLSLIEANPKPALELMQSFEAEIECRNMFGVLEKAALLINESQTEKKEIDSDKMKRLKDLSKEFSSNDMQTVIAGILAGEYNEPGSFSLKTMDIVRHLSKQEINLFRKFLGLVFLGNCLPEDFFNNSTNFVNSGLTYIELLELENLGLISGKSSQKNIPGDSEKESIFSCNIGGKQQLFNYKGEKQLSGLFFLTKSGSEVAKLLEPIFNQFCFDYVCKYLEGVGFAKFPVV